ncbi:uncharacterized protein LOC129752763 [Uranotaenia lowii]|uniref:uncharacterized protein LOC129752763 n=1 Tax=Uranotaenia lowii TaxID=190385 RepID=UPI002479C030|nr:uncharacterized protein LOC129752763 [Uranotaenia lowii]
MESVQKRTPVLWCTGYHQHLRSSCISRLTGKSFVPRVVYPRSSGDFPPVFEITHLATVTGQDTRALESSIMAGKYVRAPSSGDDARDNKMNSLSNEEESAGNHLECSGRYVRAPVISESEEQAANMYAHYYNEAEEDVHTQLQDKIRELEEVIQQMQNTNRCLENNEPIPDSSSKSTTSGEGSIRCDIKPYPKNVPASKMWEAWTKFIEDFQLSVTLLNAHDPKRRIDLLMLYMGDDLKGVVRAAKLKPTVENGECYETFVRNIDQYLKSMTDPAAEHEAFSCMQQEEGESAIGFHARLSEKVRLCGYSEPDQDVFVRAQLMRGLRNQEVKQQARIYGLKTNEIVVSATRAEAFHTEVKTRVAECSAMAIRSYSTRDSRSRNKRRSDSAKEFASHTKRYRYTDNRSYGRGRSSSDNSSVSRRYRCTRCFEDRSTHDNGICPKLEKRCYNCNREGHIARACRLNRVNELRHDRSPKRENDEHEQQINSLSLCDVLVDCRIGSSTPIKFLIDSGADVNVIGGNDWSKLEQEICAGQAHVISKSSHTNRNLQAYATRRPMNIECILEATVETVKSRKSIMTAEFIVVKEGRQSLLGRATASDMGLLRVGVEINSCTETKIFPKMPGVRVNFSIDTSIPPVKNAYCNIPAAYRQAARLRLEQMEASGIIEKITHAPRWISGMSAVPKGKDDFRLVVNMRAPNRAIKREYFRLPLVDEMRVKLHGARYFTKLDLSNAYYHLELGLESRDLTTFLADNGMYRFTRLMFGVNCAPEIFQREMCRILEHIENKIVYIDDVLIYATTLKVLRETVSLVLQIFKSNNLTLNTAKCEFDRTEIAFLGHHLDKNGFNIEISKIKDIEKFESPSNASELRSFLGLASFISPHIRNFADLTAPLWAATANNAWRWGEEQQTAFNLVKNQIIHCTTSLGFFSETDKTILYTDASPHALGAVLVQENSDKIPRIISFASKALTETERKYPQNQREALGAVWAVERFSYFLTGRPFTLRTDAQGMAFIISRPREESKRALTRADGWSLRLSPYIYEVEYIKGLDNIADPSSRLYRGEDEAFNEDVSPWEICHLQTNFYEFLTRQEIQDCTKNDEILQQVICSLESGKWPANISRYKTVANDLHVVEDILVKNGCAVIPMELREKVLNIAHLGHPLEAKLKSILRKRVWWPGMAKDAEQWVKSCASCAINGKPEKPTPMQRIFAPRMVWDTLAIDFNGPYHKLGGILILVVIDLRSRYAIASPVKSTRFEYTKAVLDSIFRREGFPKAIKSDNGPPFNGEEFKEYCNKRGIKTIFSTPFYPQQNGLVESFMKVVNKAISTALYSNTDYRCELQAAVDAGRRTTLPQRCPLKKFSWAVEFNEGCRSLMMITFQIQCIQMKPWTGTTVIIKSAQNTEKTSDVVQGHAESKKVTL